MSNESDVDDAALVRAVADGDESALQVLFRRHVPWLKARLARRCEDPEVVADVLQDTFVAAWKGARRWRGDGDVAAWLWGIAVRRLVSRLRGRPAPALLGADLIETALIETAHGSMASAEELVLLGAEHGDVGTALGRLSPELQAVMVATVLDGLTTREAAGLLGLAQGTVKGRIRKAKAQLRTDLVSYQMGRP